MLSEAAPQPRFTSVPMHTEGADAASPGFASGFWGLLSATAQRRRERGARGKIQTPKKLPLPKPPQGSALPP